VVLAVLLLLGGVIISLYTDLLWFGSVGYREVFTTVLTTRLLLFIGFGLLMALIVGINVVLAYRLRPPFRPMSLEQQNLERYRVAVEPFLTPVLLLGAGVFGLFAGLSAAARWQTWLLWRNGTSFGQTDAQFGRDISYFAFTYPFQRFVLGFLLTAIVFALLASAATHYLFGGVRLQTLGEKVSPAARRHLSVLIGLIVLLKAFAYYLDRFGLAFSTAGSSRAPATPTSTRCCRQEHPDRHRGGLRAAVLRQHRGPQHPAAGRRAGPAGRVLGRRRRHLPGLHPAVPGQAGRGPPRGAVHRPQHRGDPCGVRHRRRRDRGLRRVAGRLADELRAQAAQLDTARLLDPARLSDTFEQLQRLTFYFGVNNQLDIDRYEVDGKQQAYVLAAREVDINNLRGAQRSWINERLVYTHGNGLIAAPPTGWTTRAGRCSWRPTTRTGRSSSTRAASTSASCRPSYSIVNTERAEIDGPLDLSRGDAEPVEGEEVEGQATFSYDGDGGVRISHIGRKLAYALKYREPNLLLSNAIRDDSRLMYIREPRERVQKVAPFLELDSDPYPAAVDGRSSGSSTATRPAAATRTRRAPTSATRSPTARPAGSRSSGG
jgi:uncharacterized membrane protein (UPF0182 family)